MSKKTKEKSPEMKTYEKNLDNVFDLIGNIGVIEMEESKNKPKDMFDDTKKEKDRLNAEYDKETKSKKTTPKKKEEKPKLKDIEPIKPPEPKEDDKYNKNNDKVRFIGELVGEDDDTENSEDAGKTPIESKRKEKGLNKNAKLGTVMTEEEVKEYGKKHGVEVVIAVPYKKSGNTKKKQNKLSLVNTQTGEIYDVRGDTCLIGKGSDCDIRIEGDKYVSRNHARITIDGSDYCIEDLSSTNGTYINKKKLKKNRIYEFYADDTIRIADIILVVKEG